MLGKMKRIIRSDIGSADVEAPGCGIMLAGLVIAVAIVLFAWIQHKKTEVVVGTISKRFEQTFIGSTNFWPRNPWRAKGGYLVSEKFIPLRAIARKANVSVYGSKELRAAANDSDSLSLMRPWYPYYVFDIHRLSDGKTAVLISESFRKPAPAQEKWINQKDCFCWTTRESLNIETPQAIYATETDAKNIRNPLSMDYTYAYDTVWEKTCESDQRTFEIVSLPVMERSGTNWCVLCPHLPGRPNADGYQLGWISWDGEAPGINCRLRTSRSELTAYINGLQQLMRKYKNPGQRDEAKKGLYAFGQAHLTQEDAKADAYTLDELNRRVGGIPLVGRHSYLLKPIQSDFEYHSLSNRAIKLMRLDSLPVWCNEVAYINLAVMP